MYEEDKDTSIKDCIINAIIVIAVVCIFCGAITYALHNHDKSQTTSPVGEIELIDSINDANKEIIVKIEILDSLKDVEKEKVIKLDNDSTLKLFYELIRK